MPARVTLAESERAAAGRSLFQSVRGEGIIRRNDFPRESPFAEKFCSPRRAVRGRRITTGDRNEVERKSHAVVTSLFLRLFYGVIKRVVEGCQIKSRENSLHSWIYPKGKSCVEKKVQCNYCRKVLLIKKLLPFRFRPLALCMDRGLMKCCRLLWSYIHVLVNLKATTRIRPAIISRSGGNYSRDPMLLRRPALNLRAVYPAAGGPCS